MLQLKSLQKIWRTAIHTCINCQLQSFGSSQFTDLGADLIWSEKAAPQEIFLNHGPISLPVRCPLARLATQTSIARSMAATGFIPASGIVGELVHITTQSTMFDMRLKPSPF